jgi:AcrR family transcriptional regulator
MGDMSRGTRQESRERIEAAILDAARAQLAEVGAAGLSLRLIAREVGMVSSAIYRYVASRDDLLTRLIVDAYNALGDAVESAVRASAGSSDADRWLTGARAIRRWSLANTHEYLLLYGTPVPGYAAPTDTIDPGTRVLFALASIVREAAEVGSARFHQRVDANVRPHHVRAHEPDTWDHDQPWSTVRRHRPAERVADRPD